jgi:hypothetical protein
MEVVQTLVDIARAASNVQSFTTQGAPEVDLHWTQTTTTHGARGTHIAGAVPATTIVHVQRNAAGKFGFAVEVAPISAKRRVPYPVITRVDPALEHVLHVGDIIASIGQIDTGWMSIAEVIELLAKTGDTQLAICRDDDAKLHDSAAHGLAGREMFRKGRGSLLFCSVLYLFSDAPYSFLGASVYASCSTLVLQQCHRSHMGRLHTPTRLEPNRPVPHSQVRWYKPDRLFNSVAQTVNRICLLCARV